MQLRQEERPANTRALAQTLLAGLVVVLGLVAGLAPLRPPAVVDAGAPAGDFSAERASADLLALTAAPHPIGTPQQQEMRDYLRQRLTALGLEPQVQRAVVVEETGAGYVQAAAVENVLARLPGSGEGRAALLLAAHYDTVPGSPGAGDNAAGVAALLETLRALGSEPPLHHDVVVLFTDGEEVGLFGAKAFAHHPWLDDVRLVVNFEARGLGGPSLMFETGPGTGATLMRRFARAVPHPLASSYAYDVYRYLPNDTDFTALSRSTGAPGFNFAFIDDFSGYHSRLDDPEHLDLRSLQHHGSHALGLSRHFAGPGLDDLSLSSSPAVYFNLPLAGLLVYSATWAPVLAVLAALLVAVALGLGLRRRRLRPARLAIALAALPLGTAAGVLAGVAVDRVVFGLADVGRGAFDSPWPYLGGMAVLAAVAVALVYRSARRWLSAAELAAGAQVWWLLLSLGTAFAAPSTSYLTTWPLLFAAAALWLLVTPGGWRDLPWPRHLAALVVLLALLLLWGPMVYLVGLAFGLGGVAVASMLSALAAALALPLLRSGDEPLPWPLPAAVALAGVVAVGLAVAQAGHDAEQPRPDTLFYVLDTENDQALWATFDGTADEWTSGFLDDGEVRPLPDLFDREPFRLLSAEAPVLALPPPRVAAVEEQALPDGRRRLRLHVESLRGGTRLRLALTSAAGPLRLRSIDGRPVEEAGGGGDAEAGGHVELRYHGVPAGGFEVELETGPGALGVTAVDRTSGLPGRRELGWRPRPADFMARPSTPTDFAEVRVRTEL